jgi:HK97 gp10 family phage protein
MAEWVEVQVTGLKELNDRLLALPDRLAKNALRAAVNAAAQTIRKEAKLRAPKQTGTLKRALYAKQIRERSGIDKQTYFVSVRTGAKRGKDGKKDDSQDAYYWKFVEFGTVNMAAKPFLRPAFEAKKRDAVVAMAAKLRQRIEKVQGGQP